MESSKAAITEFLSKGGQHDTTVHETVAPVVTHEVVNPTQHEEVTTAIEKEVHQDHYHTTVQPINDREVLPEVHTHALAPVEHLNFNHDSTDLNLQKLAEESAKYKDERTVLPTVNTTAAAPVVSAEHTHHHIHELIQPVIHKETIQPTVIHTTIPIHEVHHNAAQHHAASALPAMTLEEYKRAGGALAGRAERTDAFAGEPKSVDGATLL
ncbi:MAG: hypothetical protein INR71_02265, partial [Terriglobus roseus]|nr:hypothetical protein [Terriglobus roseus]